MRLRVLIVARWYPAHDNPGRGSFVADLVEALVGEDCDVRVASWEYAGYNRLSPRRSVVRATELWAAAVSRAEALNTPRRWGAGVPVARLPALHMTDETLGQQIDAHAASLLAFGTALHDRWPFEVIHAHTGLPDGVAATRLGPAVGAPVVVTEHDRTLRERLPASVEARRAYRQMLGDAALTVAVSAQYRDLLCTALEVPTTVIDVLPNALPAAFFSAPLDASRDPDELLYVGGRKENKGMTTLLEAFALARAAHPTLSLRLVGQSENEEDERHWHGLAEKLGIAGSVQFDPPGDRVAIARAMSRAGVFVHPSPFESFGMVAAEALAAGLPIAATPSGVEEIVGTDGTVGEIASALDAPALHAAIERVLERRSQFVPERQRESVVRFEASNVARETIGRYRAVIEAQPQKRATKRSPARAPEAAHEHGSSASSGPRTFRAPLVVGLNRRVAERRLSELPAALEESLVLATRTPKGAEETRTPVGRVIEIDVEGAYRAKLAALGAPPGARWSPAQRAWHFIRSPLAALTRRRLRKNPNPFLVEAARRLVREAWERDRADDGGTRPLLALDVNDALAAQDAIAAGGELAPGGTRWLADRWDEWQAETRSAR
jgi:glycosyltransferase involved in cell wall biosynthesis